jgi:hypothetical protein
MEKKSRGTICSLRATPRVKRKTCCERAVSSAFVAYDHIETDMEAIGASMKASGRISNATHYASYQRIILFSLGIAENKLANRKGLSTHDVA